MQPQAQRVFKSSKESSEGRRRRVAAAISDCLSSLPSYVAQLDALLNAAPIDLACVTKIISRNSEFCSLLLGLASTELFNARCCSVTVSQAVVLFGAERLRALALAFSFLKNSGRELSHLDRQQLWQHSFLTAVLSERTARQVGRAENGQAYVAGLLHDIGRLPLLAVAREEMATGESLLPNWSDSLKDERIFFGVDHCEVGKLLAGAWNLAPSFVDPIAHHHSPAHALHDPILTEIVAAGDRYANLLSPFAAEEFADRLAPKVDAVDALLQLCVPRLQAGNSADALEILQDDEFGEALTAQLLN